jgi:hypothetical protein
VINFSLALTYLRTGVRVARQGWPQGRFLIVVGGSTFEVTADRPLGRAAPDLVGGRVDYQAHIDVVDLASRTVSVWHPDSGDLLAEDWIITD